jgi:hypothetical protein
MIMPSYKLIFEAPAKLSESVTPAKAGVQKSL